MKIKVIYNRYIPLGDNGAMTFMPWIFTKRTLKDHELNHEMIHVEQQKEMLMLGVVLAIALALAGLGWWSLLALPLFFVWYGIEYAIRFIVYRNHYEAYRNISLEQEAYMNQYDYGYTNYRKPFAWILWIWKKEFNKKV